MPGVAAVVDLAKDAGSVGQTIKGWLDLWDKINTTRQITMDVRNLTDARLTRLGEFFAHGNYGDPPASDHIDPMTAQLFLVGTVGGGVLTGVEGRIGWQVENADASMVAIFDNPWIGSNSGGTLTEGSAAGQYKFRATVGGGNHAHFIYEFMKNGA